MKNHYVSATLFLAVAFGGIGYGAASGIEAAREAKKRELINAQLTKAFELANGRNFDAAIGIFQQLTREYPDVAEGWLNLGIAQKALERWDDADASFSKVLQLDPDDYDAVAERAWLLVRQEKIDEGLELLATIPRGKGRMQRRLLDDYLWRAPPVSQDRRLREIYEKHGLVPPRAGQQDTSTVILRR